MSDWDDSSPVPMNYAGNSAPPADTGSSNYRGGRGGRPNNRFGGNDDGGRQGNRGGGYDRYGGNNGGGGGGGGRRQYSRGGHDGFGSSDGGGGGRQNDRGFDRYGSSDGGRQNDRGFDRFGGNDGGRQNRGYNRNDDAVTMKVPSRFVGRIIGKGGSKINDMQFESGAKITVTKEEEDGETIVKLIGSAEATKRAEEMIKELLVDRSAPMRD